MELIYLFHNFSINVLNESKSADGFWTTDIVHSIFFTNRKYLLQISRKKRNNSLLLPVSCNSSINIISSSEPRIPVE